MFRIGGYFLVLFAILAGLTAFSSLTFFGGMPSSNFIFNNLIVDTNWIDTNLGFSFVSNTNGGYTNLVWSDEFSDTNGAPPNPYNWTNDLGGGGWGNNELEYYRTKDAYIYQGTLVIRVQNQTNGSLFYTSARLKTKGLQSWTYGRFAARISLAFGKRLWPAFWMMGVTNLTGLTNGEIDIMENRGTESNITSGALHTTGHSGGGCLPAPGLNKYTMPGGDTVNSNYHVYEVVWTANDVKWYVDSSNYQTVTKAQVNTSGTWVFDNPMYFLINTAVASDTSPYYNGAPDGPMNFPNYMFVDWVRVYTN